MAKLIGSVDQLGRPLVRIAVSHDHDDLLAMVDTGFNGELMMGLHTAKTCKVDLESDLVPIELGNGAIAKVYKGAVTIEWLGRKHVASVLVSDDWPPAPADAPIAMIGTRLLRPHLLLVDFETSTVEIETTS